MGIWYGARRAYWTILQMEFTWSYVGKLELWQVQGIKFQWKRRPVLSLEMDTGQPLAAGTIYLQANDIHVAELWGLWEGLRWATFKLFLLTWFGLKRILWTSPPPLQRWEGEEEVACSLIEGICWEWRRRCGLAGKTAESDEGSSMCNKIASELTTGLWLWVCEWVTKLQHIFQIETFGLSI